MAQQHPQQQRQQQQMRHFKTSSERHRRTQSGSGAGAGALGEAGAWGQHRCVVMWVLSVLRVGLVGE